MRTLEVTVTDAEGASHSVTLKKYTAGDRLTWQEAFEGARLKADTKALLESDWKCIVLGVDAWDFEIDGKPVPVTMQGVARLDPESVDALVDAVTEYNPAVFPDATATKRQFAWLVSQMTERPCEGCPETCKGSEDRNLAECWMNAAERATARPT